MTLPVDLVIGLLDGLGGGTEQHLLALCEGLPARGFEPQVVCVLDDPFLKSSPLPVPVEALCAPGGVPGLWRWRAARRLATRWERRRPAAALAFFDNAQYAAVCAARRLGPARPAVLSARRNMGTERRGPGWRMIRSTNEGVARFVCNSDAVRARAVEREGLDPSRAEVVYNGIDLRPVAPENWRAARHVPPGAPVVACVSGHRPVKGVDLFLRAFAEVGRQVPEAHALLVGDGPQRPVLERTARSLGLASRVHFLGWRGDPRPLLAGCALGALASHSEGFSNALLEYMAAGLPVVATRVGGNPEAVRDGQEGFLVEPGDQAALGAAMIRLLRDDALRTRMGAGALLRARARFDRSVMLDGMAHILKEAIGACPR